MPSTYNQIYDGDWNEVPREWTIGCCDCGLVHQFKFRIKKVGNLRKLLVRINRDDRATGQKRRHMKVKVVSTAK